MAMVARAVGAAMQVMLEPSGAHRMDLAAEVVAELAAATVEMVATTALVAAEQGKADQREQEARASSSLLIADPPAHKVDL